MHMSEMIKFITLVFAVSAGLVFEANAYNSADMVTKNRSELKGDFTMALANDQVGPSAGQRAGGKVILIGASYAAGLSMDKIAGRIMVNKGIGGEQSFETLARFDKAVISEKPDSVILWGFINDIFRSDPEKLDITIERIKESYVKMVKKAREHNIAPIVCTEITMSLRKGFIETIVGTIYSLIGKKSYQDHINQHVMQVNQWLKDFAEEQGIFMLDFQKLLSGGGTMRKKEYSQKDGSHISPEGYRIISEFISTNLSHF